MAFLDHVEPYLVCRRNCSDLTYGAACPDCDHWSGVHPNVANPRLDVCQLCELRRLIKAEQEWFDAVRSRESS